MCVFYLKIFFEEFRDWITLFDGISVMFCVLRCSVDV